MNKSDLLICLAVVILLVSTTGYVAIGDALKNFRRRISQFVFRPVIGIAPPPPPTRRKKRKKGLRLIE